MPKTAKLAAMLPLQFETWRIRARLTVRDAAFVLGVSDRQVRNYARQGGPHALLMACFAHDHGFTFAAGAAWQSALEHATVADYVHAVEHGERVSRGHALRKKRRA